MTVRRYVWLAISLLLAMGVNGQTAENERNLRDATENEFNRQVEESARASVMAPRDGSELLKREPDPISPQAGYLKKFGEYSMDYSTGVPHITIPLYEIRMGDYTLPISIDYHAAGIKVQDIASPVGLGWSLMAGGSIIRQTKGVVDNGVPELKSESDINEFFQRGGLEDAFWYYLTIGQGGDTESDRYNYSFNGKNGVFRCAVEDNMAIRTLPYTVLKITKSGNGFLITDTDGIRYHFMEEEQSRGDFTYGGGRKTMTWYLTKIEFADKNDSIVFKYIKGNYYYQQYKSEFVHQGLVYHCNPDEETDHWEYSPATLDNSAAHTVESGNTLLKEIKWRGNRVVFDYLHDREDYIMYIANNRLSRLTAVSVVNNQGRTVRKVSFTPYYSGGTALMNRMFLRDVTIMGSGVAPDCEKYTFGYNNISLPNYYTSTFSIPSIQDRLCHEDYWGYFNGTSSIDWIPSAYVPSTMTGANRSVSQRHAKAGILEKITYPTGGYTVFDFESNRLDNGTLWGGLRLASVKDYGADQTLISQKTYQYGQAQPSVLTLDGLYNDDCTYIYHVFEWVYGRLIQNLGVSRHLIAVNHPFIPLTADYGFPVYYQEVTEFYGTATKNQGKVVYNYRESRVQDQIDYEDTNAAAESVRTYSSTYNIDQGNISTLLTDKKVYENQNGSYQLSRSEHYSYEDVRKEAFLAGVHFLAKNAYMDLGSGRAPDKNRFADVYTFHNVYALPSYVRLSDKTEKDYGAKVTVTTSYSYDKQERTLEPIAEKVSSVSGDNYERRYSYPFNQSGYADMVAANMLIPVQVQTYRNGVLVETVKRSYTRQNGFFVNTAVSMAKGNNPLEERVRFEYDGYGNLTCVIRNGTDKTGYVWSYKCMYPILRVEGMNTSEMSTASASVTSLSSLADNASPSATVVNGLVQALNNAGGMVTAYTYTPLLGVSMVQNPRGENSYYTYNTTGRLASVQDHYRRTVEDYTYSYGTQNYVRARFMTNTLGTAYRESTDYYDGLGQKSETVAKGQAPDGNDLVLLTEYDSFGRPETEWLPTAFPQTGNYVSPTVYKTADRAYYQGDQKPFRLIGYENCPSDKVIRQFGPGELWHRNGRAVRMEYTSNTSAAPYDCRIYTTEGDGASVRCKGNYPANELFVVKTTDEDMNPVYIFTDKEGRLILERRMAGTVKYDTYYVYDIYGNLTFVLPPTASDAISAVNALYDIASTPVLQQYGYHYQYDSRNRCVSKKLPGCRAVVMKYDKADRLVFSQDGNQSGKQWTFRLYDKYGREAIMGTTSTNSIPNPVNTAAIATFTGSGPLAGYTCPLSLSGPCLLTVNYYDHYGYLSSQGQLNRLNLNVSGSSNPAFPNNVGTNARGMLTGTRIALLNSQNNYSFTSYYYGERGRLVQKHSQNNLGGFTDEYNTYNFVGTKSSRMQVVTANGDKTVHTEMYIYTYDHASRLTGIVYKLDENAPVSLQANTYDAVGRLHTKRLMNTETITYACNVRGWLTGIGSAHFTETLAYNGATGSLVPSAGQWGGNVSAMAWKAGDEENLRSYQFSYTPVGWLAGGIYSGLGNFTTAYSYDKMGNLRTLKRYGLQDGGTYGLIDNLAFTYTGNQAAKIEDSVTDPTYNGAFNFSDGSSGAKEYEYDQNGNTTKDLNKKIASVTYNLLNLPDKVTFQNGNTITYSYNAAGKKIGVGYGFVTYGVHFDYCDNYLYTNGVLKEMLIDGGYVTFNGTIPVYHYYLQDHLGNNRVVANTLGAVEQVNHYYPFGGLFGESTHGDTQRYKYNGKELDRMHGIDWYDYGARHYDGMRFVTVDPLAEQDYTTSPYVYALNNPVSNIDLDGRSALRGLKIVWRIGKQVAKKGISALNQAGTYIEAFSDIKENLDVLADENASSIDKIAAGISLASEALPVSNGDIKDVGKLLKGHKEFLPGREKTYQTYTKLNKKTGQIYVGRTSGTDIPTRNVFKRDKNHHMNKKGYAAAKLDKTSHNPDAIRGREQYMIDKHGGAQSEGGTSGNAINGISRANPKYKEYEEARKGEFGD